MHKKIHMKCDHKSDSFSCRLCEAGLGSFMNDLPSELEKELEDSKKRMRIKKDQVLFHEGTLPLGLYCIDEGKIKLNIIGSDGREQIVRLLKSGEVLGYRALLSGDHYNATATAIEDTEVCLIPKSIIDKMILKSDKFLKELIRKLSSDLAQAEQNMTSIAHKSLRQRVAEAIIHLKEVYGFENDNQTIAVVLSREEIASVVGTATESIIRQLSDLKKEGMIELEGKRIKILNENKLITTADI
ncbi:MAG: Crp/Fnr family transcriptional regulator [Bacteroidetes bacterium]|nr:Crp/Fnr family transcriptional regulator [Bacteroidota bacterium]